MSAIRGINFKELITSRLFTFLVGPFKVPITVHVNALARLSPPLDTLMNSSMKEAQEGKAILEDLDLETFTCVTQFAYSGNYGIPGIQNSEDTRNRYEVHDMWEIPLSLPNIRPSPTASSTCSLWDRSYNVETSSARSRRDDDAESEQDAGQDSSLAGQGTYGLLTHLEVFRFADMYDVEGLGGLAHGKIIQTLCTLDMTDKTVGEVITLMRRICPNDGSQVEYNLMYNLVQESIQVMVRRAHDLVGLAEFAAFLREGGEANVLLFNAIVKDREKLMSHKW